MATRTLQRPSQPTVLPALLSATLRALPVLVLGPLLTAGCGAKDLPELPPAPMVAAPAPAEVESVVFFIGDAGHTLPATHPIVHAFQRDIEDWSEKLPGDTTVAVVVLGDMVYPNGLHDRAHPAFTADSVHVATQADFVGGEAARASAWEFFVAGNHDWGLEEDWEGWRRLHNLDSLLMDVRATGYPVSLEPPPGEGGPVVVDLGRHLRLLLLDTAWWLLYAEDEDREALIQGLEEATRTAGDRHIVIASHHPFQSAGSHGGTISFWRGFGVSYALARAGAILQDLNSAPYRDLKGAIQRVGASQRPALLHAGGHDHSLQVIRDPSTDVGSPRYSLVAGSASKLSEVGHVAGMLMRRSWPGYARMFVLRDGGVILSMVGAPPEYLSCEEEGPDRQRCMDEGVEAYRTLWSDRIH